MAKWSLVGEVTISVSTEVEAETEEEARAIAECRDLVTLKATWQDDPDSEWCTSGELDGSVTIIEVSRVE